MNQGNYDPIEPLIKAIQLYKKALKVQNPIISPRDCLKTARNLGKIAFLIQQWNEAIFAYNKAIEAVELMRSSAITSQDEEQQILSESLDDYIKLITAYINNNNNRDALIIVDEIKSRNLLELIETCELRPKGNYHPQVLKKLSQLRKDIALLKKGLNQPPQETKIINNFSQSGHSYTHSNQILISTSNRLVELRQELKLLIQQKINPIDSTFTVIEQPQRLCFEAVTNLLHDETAIIQWCFLEDRLVTFLVTSSNDDNNPTLIDNNINSQEFLSWFETYYNSYLLFRQRNNPGETTWNNTLTTSLTQLSGILKIQEILDQLPNNCRHIILIPHRHLHLIPFQALPINENEYLLDKYLVSYAPSCKIWQKLQQRERENNTHLFGIQNPNCNLIYTDIEVDFIKQLFQPNVNVLSAANANKTNLYLQSLAEVSHVHFSCHGYFNFETPLSSALVLADPPNTLTETLPESCDVVIRSPEGVDYNLNRCLTLKEIFSLNLIQCCLVVLSACETGITNFNNVDEYLSLASGFFFAGSATVIVSQWVVNDLSTALLMMNFYFNFKQKEMPFIEALLKAQKWLKDSDKNHLITWVQTLDDSLVSNSQKLEIIAQLRYLSDEKPFNSPYHWAGFCVVGKVHQN